MPDYETNRRQFDGARDALEALQNGEVSSREVRDQFSHITDIERAISVAIAKREQDITDEEWEDSFSGDFFHD